MSKKHRFGPILGPKTGDFEGFRSTNKDFLIKIFHTISVFILCRLYHILRTFDFLLLNTTYLGDLGPS